VRRATQERIGLAIWNVSFGVALGVLMAMWLVNAARFAGCEPTWWGWGCP
jgi:hypothetical protein